MMKTVQTASRVQKTIVATVGRVLLCLGVIASVSACDMLVSDNPLCQYDCSVNTTRSVGGVE